jgi:hypothetical protein
MQLNYEGAKMDKRHVQTFLMVSAAFFAMNLPARSASAEPLAAAGVHATQQAAPRTATVPDQSVRAARVDGLRARR